MVVLKFWRPITGIIGKRLILNSSSSRMTKFRYLSQDSQQPASSGGEGGSVEEFMREHEITINGRDSENFRPIFKFEETNFPTPIIQALKKQFDAPSVIQSVSWPPVLAGRDLVGIARTGSGKTLAFMLPALVHISNQKPIKRGDGPIVLVLCPTRELAQQVQAVATEWGNLLTHVRTMCAFGGANRGPQEMKLQAGVEIVVATPGRLNDFLTSRVTNMRRCSYLVLDEADRMLDMGFEPQIRQIIDQIDTERQTVMFSATWPKEVQNLAGDFMKDFVQIKIGSAELSANKNITQIVHVTTTAKRDRQFWFLIKDLLKRDPDAKMLVFCLQKIQADKLEQLARDRCGVDASAIHGDKSQLSRDRILKSFRSGRTQMLFATDVAARGLDVDDIKYVINYDHPFVVEDYVHRIGRTARRDLKGESHTFLTEEDAGERAQDLINVLEASEQPVSDELKRLAATRNSSSKRQVRRWGSYSREGFSTPQRDYGRSHQIAGRDSSYSFSDQRKQGQHQRSRYDRYEEEEDNDEAVSSRRDYSGQNRYTNIDTRQRRLTSSRRNVDEDDDDYFDDLGEKSAPRRR